MAVKHVPENPRSESEASTYQFKEGGNSVVLSPRRNFETGRTPILFSKNIGRLKDVLAARGIEVGRIERDPQGIRYFQIYDPEGNVIEAVEER